MLSVRRSSMILKLRLPYRIETNLGEAKKDIHRRDKDERKACIATIPIKDDSILQMNPRDSSCRTNTMGLSTDLLLEVMGLPIVNNNIMDKTITVHPLGKVGVGALSRPCLSTGLVNAMMILADEEEVEASLVEEEEAVVCQEEAISEVDSMAVAVDHSLLIQCPTVVSAGLVCSET